MLSLINRFRTDERGASAVEYTMLVVFIALAIAAGAQTFGTDLSQWLLKDRCQYRRPQYQHPGSPVGSAYRSGRQRDIPLPTLISG